MKLKRMMILGAAASALALAGCQDRARQDQADQPSTGGSGIDQDNYRGPGGTGTDVPSPQDVPATEPGMGGADDTGGSGTIGGEGDVGGTGDVDGTGGSGTIEGSVDDQDTTVSPDGMDGTDDPPVQDDQLGGSMERDSVNR